MITNNHNTNKHRYATGLQLTHLTEQVIVEALTTSHEKYVAFILSGEVEEGFSPEDYLGEETIIV